MNAIHFAISVAEAWRSFPDSLYEIPSLQVERRKGETVAEAGLRTLADYADGRYAVATLVARKTRGQ